MEGGKGESAEGDRCEDCTEEELLRGVLARGGVHVGELYEDGQGMTHLWEEGEADHEDIQVIVRRSVVEPEPQRPENPHLQAEIIIPAIAYSRASEDGLRREPLADTPHLVELSNRRKHLYGQTERSEEHRKGLQISIRTTDSRVEIDPC